MEGTRNVFDAALDRCREWMSRDEPYIVSFSGGKDSTTILMCSLIVAKELNKLPVRAVYIDEEIIDPATIEYIEQVRLWPEVQFDWICYPLIHTLRSKMRPHWKTWDPECKDLWVRQQPPWAITDIGDDPRPGDVSYTSIVSQYYQRKLGMKNINVVTGIRMAESFNRRRTIMNIGNYYSDIYPGYITVRPIFDWSTDDVWKAIVKFDWPHSKHYDNLWLKGMSLQGQRVAAWGNVAAMEISYFPEFYPEFWEKAIKRLPELRTSQRYRHTKLYREVMNKPDGLTWQEYCFKLLETLQPEDREYWKNKITISLRKWSKRSTLPFPETSYDIVGASWKRYCYVIGKNDRISGSSRDPI